VGVIGVADILLTKPGMAPDLREQLDVIHMSGKALLSLVNNILDLSRMDARMLTLDKRVRRPFPHVRQRL